MIIWGGVFLKGTLLGDSDWCLDNLSGIRQVRWLLLSCQKTVNDNNRSFQNHTHLDNRVSSKRRPKTKDLENEDPLENEDLENEDPLETKTSKTKTP